MNKEEIPLDIVQTLYEEQIQILGDTLGIQFDLVLVRENHTKIYGSFPDMDSFAEKNERAKYEELLQCLKVELEGLLEESLQRIFSLFDPEMKTPTLISWESI